MIENTIARLFESKGLGEVLPPITPVSGGLMHRMYRVNTAGRAYAVKHLNPDIMKRPDAMDNYRRAEALESMLEETNIPIAPALTIDGHKMQRMDGEYFYVFRWLNGQIADGRELTAMQCAQVGGILGRVHALRPKRVAHKEPTLSAVDWAGYAAEAEKQHSVVAPLLKKNMALLEYAQDALNAARQALPDIACVTDGDMDPKNVMWEEGQPVVIDLECLDEGNPVSDALRLSLDWAGVAHCAFDPDLQHAFLRGYLDVYNNGFRDYGSVVGLAYTWIEWLKYNVGRALGKCQDEGERETGLAEAQSTIDRLRFIREQENAIRANLARLF